MSGDEESHTSSTELAGKAAGPARDAADGSEPDADADEAGTRFRARATENFKSFDPLDLNLLSPNQLYAVLNLGMDADDEVGEAVLSDVTEIVGLPKRGAYDLETFGRILDEIELRRANEAEGGVASWSKGVRGVWAFLILMLWPVTVIFAMPLGSIDDQPYFVQFIRHVYRHFLRETMVPYRVRRVLANNPCAFLVSYVGISLSHVFGVFAVGTYAYLVGEDSTGNISFLEPALPVTLGVVGAALVASSLALDDEDDLAAIRGMEVGGALSKVKVELGPVDSVPEERLEAAAASGMAGEDPAVSDVLRVWKPRVAKDYLVRMLAETPDERRSRVFMLRLSSALSFVLAIGFACSPFILRYATDKELLGECDADSNVSDPGRCRDNRNLARSVTVGAFIVSLPLLWWYFTRLFTTYGVFLERARIYSDLTAVLDPEAALEHNLGAYLDMSRPNNVVAWSKLRTFVVSFHRVAVRRVEGLLAAIALFLVMLLPLVIYERVEGWEAEIDSQYVVFVAGILAGLIGIFLLYPILSLGIYINWQSEQWVAFFAAEHWRVTLVAECARGVATRAYHSSAATLCGGMYDFLVRTGEQLTILGVAITTGLVASIGAPIAAAVLSLVVEVVFPSEEGV